MAAAPEMSPSDSGDDDESERGGVQSRHGVVRGNLGRVPGPEGALGRLASEYGRFGTTFGRNASDTVSTRLQSPGRQQTTTLPPLPGSPRGRSSENLIPWVDPASAQAEALRMRGGSLADH